MEAHRPTVGWMRRALRGVLKTLPACRFVVASMALFTLV